MKTSYANTDGHMMELMVADLLRRTGFVIIEQNYRVGNLEIDLIALEGETLCFIEVKSRAHPIRYDELDTIITYKQRRNIINAADSFCRYNDKIHYTNIRFDYVLVHAPQGSPPKVRYIRSAFTPTHDDFQ